MKLNNKTMKSLLSVLFISIAVFSYSQTNTVTYLPYVKNNKFVFCDNNGKQVIDSSFDYAEPFYENFAIVSNNSKYGVINSKGKVVVPIQYKNAKFSFYRKQITPSNPNGIYFTVNYSKFTFGKDTSQIHYNYVGKRIPNELISSQMLGSSGNSSSVFKKDNLYGFRNNRDTIIKPMYTKLESVSYNLLIAKNNKDSVGIITNKNKVIIPFMYKNIVVNTENELLFRVYSNDKEYCFLFIISERENVQKTYCNYKCIDKILGHRYALVLDNNTKFYLDLHTGKELKF